MMQHGIKLKLTSYRTDEADAEPRLRSILITVPTVVTVTFRTICCPRQRIWDSPDELVALPTITGLGTYPQTSADPKVGQTVGRLPGQTAVSPAMLLNSVL